MSEQPSTDIGGDANATATELQAAAHADYEQAHPADPDASASPAAYAIDLDEI